MDLSTKLDTNQIANFAYWLTEKNNNRNISNFNGKKRIDYIQNTLLPEFLRKYPTGILTGWNESVSDD